MKIKKEKQVKPERPSGFLDFNTPDFLAREKMLTTINKVFQSFGYNPIETPIIEFTKTLTGEDETSKNIFIVKSSNDQGEPLGMRFDHTVPFARFLSANPYNSKTKKGVKLPFKRMVIGPVFRGETPQKGRYRQFYQADIDIAGTSSMLADSEIIAIIYETLKALGATNFIIRINNRKILNGLSKLVGIKSRQKISEDDITKKMMLILDKIDKIGLDGVFQELQKAPDNEYDPAPNLSKENINKIKSYLEIDGDNHKKLKQCQKIFENIPIALEGINELQEIIKLTESLEIPSKILKIDFSIARGLDYYTGPVMEASLLDAPEFGSVFSGGRYDGLVKRFTGDELPAVGASIGVDRLFKALEHLELINAQKKTSVDVMIMRLSENYDNHYLKIASQLRKLNLNVDICLIKDTTWKSQFNFALNHGAKFVVICGEDEIKKDIIQIKNLNSREQKEIKFSNQELNNYFLNE
ncbi:histidine--tRNA ligase [bacterium]|nr:histidine--tRNA ligase [bacterium]